MNYKTSTSMYIAKQGCFDIMQNVMFKKVHKFKILTQINKLQKHSQLQQNKKLLKTPKIMNFYTRPLMI
jgi:hypothetical protein